MCFPCMRMRIGIGMNGSATNFVSKNSTERELESIYLNISLFRYSLASLVCRDGLGCLGYKYVLHPL